MAQFFIARADDLIAPLASIECLLSDPAVAHGADQLGIGLFAHDPRAGDDSVEPALSSLAKDAADRWLDRCQAGDTMFFYMASHGFVDSDFSALGALEDLGSVPRRAWENAINIQNLANSLPTTGAAGCFVFLDACQDVVTDALANYNGTGAIELFRSGLLKKTRTPVRSVALAGSRFGKKAWAPTDGSPPFFTQTLIEGMSTCCVERVHGLGWAVTGLQLMNGLEHVADAALDHVGLQTEALVGFKERVNLLKVVDPQIPIAVRTTVEGRINLASSVTAKDGNGTLFTRDDAALTWRFRIPPSRSTFVARAEFAGPPASASDREFDADAPAQIVTL